MLNIYVQIYIYTGVCMYKIRDALGNERTAYTRMYNLNPLYMSFIQVYVIYQQSCIRNVYIYECVYTRLTVIRAYVYRVIVLISVLKVPLTADISSSKYNLPIFYFNGKNPPLLEPEILKWLVCVRADACPTRTGERTNFSNVHFRIEFFEIRD